MNPTENGSSLSPLIHLLDDDAAVRQSLSLLISTVGLRVQTWADPQQFLESFDRQSIGALILDVRMPGISGLTLLDTLIEQGVDQPIILLTGHGTVDMCRRAFKAGALGMKVSKTLGQGAKNRCSRCLRVRCTCSTVPALVLSECV